MSYRSRHAPSGPSNDRLILPASAGEPEPLSASGASANGDSDGILTRPVKQMPKRKQVTAVACSAWKQRKSKCDGQRPTCTSCTKRGQTDCQYDINSDQRRTTALKERIEELKQEADDLKTILAAVFAEPGCPTTMSAVQGLMATGFQHVHEVADVLRAKMREIHALDEMRQRQAMGAGIATLAYSQPNLLPTPLPSSVGQHYGTAQAAAALSPVSVSTISSETDYRTEQWMYQHHGGHQQWPGM